jgi:hypothetical protein
MTQNIKITTATAISPRMVDDDKRGRGFSSIHLPKGPPYRLAYKFYMHCCVGTISELPFTWGVRYAVRKLLH